MSDFTIHDGTPLAGVTEGMTVVDADGAEVGTVKEVKIGDPDLPTAQGQDAPATGTVFTEMADAFSGLVGDHDGPPAESRDRLLRTGYLRVGGGLLSSARFVAADQVAGVEDGVVRLTVTQDRLDK